MATRVGLCRESVLDTAFLAIPIAREKWPVWKILMYTFFALAVLSPITTEVVRSIVHRSRERRYGIGGTQDILMWGIFITLAWSVGALVCVLIWYEHLHR